MEVQSRSGHGGADVGHIGIGGRGNFRGRGRGDGSGRGRIYNNWRGSGRGEGVREEISRGRGRGDGSGRGRIYNNWRDSGRGEGVREEISRGRGRGDGLGRGNNWRGRSRGRGEEISAGGRNWGHSHRDCGQHYQSEKKTSLEQSYEIDPLQLFVGNLQKNVNEDQLLATLTPYANVLSVVIIKKPFKGAPNFGFVNLPTEGDVKKIMYLNNMGCFLSGSKLIFRPARKRSMPPRECVLVQESIPDRDYDLSPIDQKKISIHVLVDDVLIKILEYLPIKKRIICEVVCRRWQALLYVMFESSTHLNLCDDYLIQNSLKVTKPMLSKMLLLKGEMLTSLSVSDVNYTVSNKFFFMIAQYCPNLEHLALTDDSMVYYEDIIALRGCKNLKSFCASKWSNLTEDSFKTLISVLPGLEKLDVSHTDIKGNCFHILPKSLKELNINHCTKVSKKNLRKLSKACKHLEVLKIEELDIDEEFLKELALNSTNLRSLTFFIRKPVDFSDQIKMFTKLRDLRIYAHTFELPNIADNVKHLEDLSVAIMTETKSKVDFGKFPHLKNVIIYNSCFRKQELMSLDKCKSIESVTIQVCDEADQETIKRIVKCCPVIKHIRCPNVDIDKKFLEDIQEIIKNRSGPLRMSIYINDCSRDVLEGKYDKLNFCFLEPSDVGDESDLYSDEDSFDDFYDDSFDTEPVYGSDMENFMFGMGYDSDES